MTLPKSGWWRMGLLVFVKLSCYSSALEDISGWLHKPSLIWCSSPEVCRFRHRNKSEHSVWPYCFSVLRVSAAKSSLVWDRQTVSGKSGDHKYVTFIEHLYTTHYIILTELTEEMRAGSQWLLRLFSWKSHPKPGDKKGQGRAAWGGRSEQLGRGGRLPWATKSRAGCALSPGASHILLHTRTLHRSFWTSWFWCYLRT